MVSSLTRMDLSIYLLLSSAFDLAPLVIMQRRETEALGTFLSYVMEQNNVSAGKLAHAAGVAENSIRNVLRFGLGEDAPAPSPKLLVAVADFLRLDPSWLFSLAGYLPTTRREIGVLGEYVAARFEELTPEQQNALLDKLEEFEKANGIPQYRKEIRKWQKKARELRGSHLSEDTRMLRNWSLFPRPPGRLRQDWPVPTRKLFHANFEQCHDHTLLG